MDATMRWTKVIRASLVRVVLACVLATVCGNHMSPEWQALILAVQKNPGLMEVLRTNPTLTRSLYSGLGLSANRARQDRCEELKQENVRLRQMIEAMIGGDLPINLAGSHPDLRALERSQRELSPVQKLFNQVSLRGTSSIAKSVLLQVTSSNVAASVPFGASLGAEHAGDAQAVLDDHRRDVQLRDDLDEAGLHRSAHHLERQQGHHHHRGHYGCHRQVPSCRCKFSKN